MNTKKTTKKVVKTEDKKITKLYDFALMLPAEMTDSERELFCQLFRERYNVDNYADISDLLSFLADYIKCYLYLSERVSNAEDNLLMTLAYTLDTFSTTFSRLYDEY